MRRGCESPHAGILTVIQISNFLYRDVNKRTDFMLNRFKYQHFVNKMNLPCQYVVLFHVVFLVECIYRDLWRLLHNRRFTLLMKYKGCTLPDALCSK